MTLERNVSLEDSVRVRYGTGSFIEFNQIQIIEKIGEGGITFVIYLQLTYYVSGYGEVFKGMWLGNTVAIKNYGKGTKAQAKVEEDFLKEVDVICKLRHPNILLFMGVCIDKTGGYLITK